MSVLRSALLISLLFLVSTALANPILVMGWEDCDIPVLGMSGSGSPPINATITTDPAHVGSGDRALQLVRTQDDGPASAYLACVYDLSYNNSFELAFVTQSDAAIALKVRYNDSLPGNLDADDGLVETIMLPTGPDFILHQFTIDTEAPHSGVVIELVLPGEMGATAWVDDLLVFIEEVTIEYPCYTVVGTKARSYTQVKDLFR